MEKSKNFLGIPKSAYFETLVFLILLVILNSFFGDGKRFIAYGLHPFWIIVLLISVQYGTLAGIMSTVLSTLFLYLGNLPLQTPQETFFEYQFRLTFLPLLWLATSFTLGEIRMKDIKESQKLNNRLEKAYEEIRTISEGYQDVKKIKESLEIQLGSQLLTSASIYKTFKSLGTLQPGLILLNVHQLIEPILNPKKMSVYSIGPNGGLESSLSKGWQENEKYLRRFAPDHPLYNAIVGKQKMICVINEEDEKILAGEGILAAPLIDAESGEIFGMLKIEEIDFFELNISNLETFKIVCELVGMAYANAKEHKKLESNAVYNTETQIYSFGFYSIMKNYLLKLAEELKIPLSLITVTSKNLNLLEIANLKNVLEKLLPGTSLICHSKRKEFEIFILIPANQEQTQNTINTIKQEKTIHEDLAFKVESLWEVAYSK